MLAVSVKDIRQTLARLDGEVVDKAVKRTLSPERLGNKVAKAMSESVRTDFAGLRKDDIDKMVKVYPKGSGSRISITSQPINLSYFGAKQIKMTKGAYTQTVRTKSKTMKTTKITKVGPQRVGVEVTLKNNKKIFLPDHFIIKAKNNAVLVVYRKPGTSGHGKGDVKAENLVSASSLFTQDPRIEVANSVLQAEFARRLSSELDYYWRKKNG